MKLAIIALFAFTVAAESASAQCANGVCTIPQRQRQAVAVTVTHEATSRPVRRVPVLRQAGRRVFQSRPVRSLLRRGCCCRR